MQIFSDIHKIHVCDLLFHTPSDIYLLLDCLLLEIWLLLYCSFVLTILQIFLKQKLWNNISYGIIMESQIWDTSVYKSIKQCSFSYLNLLIQIYTDGQKFELLRFLLTKAAFIWSEIQ